MSTREVSGDEHVRPAIPLPFHIRGANAQITPARMA